MFFIYLLSGNCQVRLEVLHEALCGWGLETDEQKAMRLGGGMLEKPRKIVTPVPSVSTRQLAVLVEEHVGILMTVKGKEDGRVGITS